MLLKLKSKIIFESKKKFFRKNPTHDTKITSKSIVSSSIKKAYKRITTRRLIYIHQSLDKKFLDDLTSEPNHSHEYSKKFVKIKLEISSHSVDRAHSSVGAISWRRVK